MKPKKCWTKILGKYKTLSLAVCITDSLIGNKRERKEGGVSKQLMIEKGREKGYGIAHSRSRRKGGRMNRNDEGTTFTYTQTHTLSLTNTHKRTTIADSRVAQLFQQVNGNILIEKSSRY